ncbi:MAG TPA: hypothetical protein VH044_04985 [Polyangiaceae bacterium]|jgi:hypothetical protein|nr:hypothetical protein [Polyangiaceae bacterium]
MRPVHVYLGVMAILTAPAEVPEDQQLQYGDIRGRVEDGDILLFRGTIFLSRVIERVSHGAYSHCAIAAAWGERKMILQAEIMGGVQVVPLSVAVGTYRGRVDWYKVRPEVRAKLNMGVLLAEARADLGLTYATSDLLRVAAHSLFGAGLPSDCDNPHALFCSQYVERCFRKAGVALSTDSDVGTSPSRIANSQALVYQGMIAHDPDVVPDRSSDAIMVAAPSLQAAQEPTRLA